MYRIIWGAAALLVATAVQPATADDRRACGSGAGDEAITACSRLLALNPKDAVAYITRGIAYNAKGDLDRAIADYNEAIRLDPKDAVTYNNRGEAYEARNDPSHALADFDQALKLDPSLAGARLGRERAQVLLAKRSNPGAETNAPAR
jgi:tetratricopeptide (TPR) repeat protein